MTEEKKKEKELQEKFVEFQVVQQQIGQVQKQIQQLAAQKAEVENVQQSVSDLKEVKEGNEMLAPVCSGIFVKANMKNSDELLVNVGNNVVVKRNTEQVKEMLETQSSEIRNMEEQLTDSLQQLAGKAHDIEKELDVLIKEAKDV
jgi:prefoldin alpha subunit